MAHIWKLCPVCRVNKLRGWRARRCRVCANKARAVARAVEREEYAERLVSGERFKFKVRPEQMREFVMIWAGEMA